MTMLALVRKLLRDVRVAIVVVMLLLAGFQCLWVKVSQRTVTEKIAGPTMGQLLILLRHVTVAAVAAGNGVWVERAPVRGGHRPGPARRLTIAAASRQRRTAVVGGAPCRPRDR